MAHTAPAGRAGWREPLAAKVPEITFLFWVLKLLTTAGGEATSDYLALHGNAVAGVVEIAIFVAAVAVQFRTRRYVAAAYWFLALAIAIFMAMLTLLLCVTGYSNVNIEGSRGSGKS